MFYRDEEERFLEKVKVEEGGKGCWLWLPSCKRRQRVGGVFHASIDGVSPKGNTCPRKYAFIKYGLVPPPEGKYRLINLCGVRMCVNPAHHLAVVTVPKAQKKEVVVVKTTYDLTPELITKIRQDKAPLKAMVIKYGVNPVLIRRLQKRVSVV